MTQPLLQLVVLQADDLADGAVKQLLKWSYMLNLLHRYNQHAA